MKASELFFLTSLVLVSPHMSPLVAVVLGGVCVALGLIVQWSGR